MCFTPAAAKIFYNPGNILAMYLIVLDFKDNSISHILTKFQVINLISSLIMLNYLTTGVKSQAKRLQIWLKFDCL